MGTKVSLLLWVLQQDVLADREGAQFTEQVHLLVTHPRIPSQLEWLSAMVPKYLHSSALSAGEPWITVGDSYHWFPSSAGEGDCHLLSFCIL